jgi:hypothetical protein
MNIIIKINHIKLKNKQKSIKNEFEVKHFINTIKNKLEKKAKSEFK